MERLSSGLWIPTPAYPEVALAEAPATVCHVYWGSHGCDLERGHDGPHVCGSPDYADPDMGDSGLCSQFDGDQVRFAEPDGSWGNEVYPNPHRYDATVQVTP